MHFVIPSKKSILPYLNNFIENKSVFTYGLLPQGRSFASNSFNDRFLRIVLTSRVSKCKICNSIILCSYLLIPAASEYFT